MNKKVILAIVAILVIANMIANSLNADKFEIVPKQPYTNADLDWTNSSSRVRFVKSNDFTGKTVIPFCSSYSSGIGQSGTNLEKRAGTGNWQKGERFSSAGSQDAVDKWLKELNFIK